MAEKAARALLVKRAVLAKVLGCSTRQIGTLEADKVFTPARRGKAGKASLFDLAVVVPAYLAHELGKQNGAGLDLEHERALLAREQRKKCADENRKRSGELVSRDQVVLEGQSYTKAWVSKLRGLPRLLVKEGIIGRELEARVSLACAALLRDIASWKTTADADQAAKEADAA